MRITLIDKSLLKELALAGFSGPFITHEGVSCVTAFSIIEQMTGATIGKLITGEWACCFLLPNNYTDFRQDECPHIAAAKAFIAWKKGLQ